VVALCVLPALGFACGYDLSRQPSEQLTARALLGAIDGYQTVLSPVLSFSGVRCRFTPSCSHYGEASIEKYGAGKGSLRAAWRVLRCGPWTERGTIDLP